MGVQTISYQLDGDRMLFKIVLSLAVLTTAACTNSKKQGASLQDVEHIVSMQQREDGTFDVVCKDLTHAVATKDEIQAGNVCVTSEPVPVPTAPEVDTIILGGYHRFSVPEGMHVTEFAWVASFNTPLMFYRVSTQSDPNYPSNYNCGQANDQKLTMTAPSGKAFDYCVTSVPNDNLYSMLTDFRLAKSHIEVATDPDLVTEQNLEVMAVDVYDSDYEWMYGRSRFEKICGNASLKSHPVTLEMNFWDLGVQAVAFTCTASFVTGVFGAPPVQMWVGALAVTPKSMALPSLGCFSNSNTEPCGQFKSAQLIEFNYVSKKAWPSSQAFAAATVKKFNEHVKPLQP